MIGFPKPRPWLLSQREARKDRDTIDRAERQKCRQRSGGRCEVIEQCVIRVCQDDVELENRVALVCCSRRATENHHLLSGIGRRNRGKSILAIHRLDVCERCHREITGHVLVPAVDEKRRELASEIRYERKS